MAKLQLENKALKAGLPVASSPGQEHAESQFDSVADEGAAVLKLSPTQAPTPPAEGIDDSANKESETDGLDDEIELLIRRNATSLRQIRRDVRQAKKQLVMAEAQPQTILKLLSILALRQHVVCPSCRSHRTQFMLQSTLRTLTSIMQSSRYASHLHKS